MTLRLVGGTRRSRDGLGPNDHVDPSGDDGATDDDALLVRHAPILRLDGRELFHPTAVDAYIAASSLWDHHGELASGLSGDDLDDRWSHRTHLRFVADGDRSRVTRAEVRRTTRRARSGRLGTVGLVGRLLDALVLLSVWLRPTTPRRTTAAAAKKADELRLHDQPTCYGRVVQAGEWIVLQYSYFYVMNDWRTGYRGLNDHEADWEQAWVFCDPADRCPVWVATSSHEYRGPNLRRHWRDPEVTIVDGRPELYVAAGSHAMYFRPGDYVTRIDLPGLRWVLRWQAAARMLLRRTEPATERGIGPALGVPFVDAADGTGPRLAAWRIEPLVGRAWAESFRGLWGLDTGDPLQGERGPSGPKFDRRSEVRASWADPLGFVGLHGTPPPSAMAARVNLDKLGRALADLDEQIRQRGRLLPLAHQTRSADEMADESARLTELLRHRTELLELAGRIERGAILPDGIRDHLRNPAVPLAPPDHGSRLLAAWAAVTAPLIMLAAGAVVVFDGARTAAAITVVVGVFLLTEQLVRHRVRAAMNRMVAIALLAVGSVFAIGAITTVAVYAAVAGLVVGSAGLLAANLIELSTRRP